jgi:hypothetical protein
MAKHWFHGKASSAKRKYLKKHPKSIYAGARAAMASGYREQVQALRDEILRLKKQLEATDDDSPNTRALMTQLRMTQRKLAILKQHYA